MVNIGQPQANPSGSSAMRGAWVRAAARATRPVRLSRLKLAFAVAVPVTVAVVQQHFWQVLSPVVWQLFLPAVFVVSWMCGRACGLLATAVSAALAWWYFIPPLQTLDKDLNAWLSTGIFLGMGVLFGEFHGAYRRANRMLRNSRLQYARLFELAPDAAFIADLSGRFVTVNAAYCRMLGCGPEEMPGRNIAEVLPPEDLAPLYQVLALLGRDGKGRAEWRFFHRNGAAVLCEISASILPDGSWQGLIRDISERRRVESQLKHTANHDALTGLPNRLRFCQVLQAALDRARRRQRKLALLYIDLDRFKEVNDKLGHAAGDQLLQEVARRLTDCVRAGDTVARLGGDEFTVVLEGISRPENAGEVARKVIAAVRQPMELCGRSVWVSASVGISVFPDDAQTTQALTHNADAALYRAKGKGRDTFELCQPEALATPEPAAARTAPPARRAAGITA